MASRSSTCVDRVLLDLELLMSNYNRSYVAAYDVAGTIRDVKFLKTFIVCARKWSQSNDLYLESDNVVEKVSLPSFLSCIDDTVHKYEEDIHSLSLRSETEDVLHALNNPLISKLRKLTESLFDDKYDEDSHSLSLRSETEEVSRSLSLRSETEEVSHTLDEQLISKFREQIKSFKQEIIQVYTTLASSRSLQSNSCSRDDELMEFIDLILQNLADLTTPYSFLRKESQVSTSSLCAALSAQFQALEVKLTFLKSFIPFAKLRGTVDIPALLLSHFEVVTLSAARLSYMCSFWDDDPERRWRNREIYSMIYEQQRKIRAVDCQVYDIYMEVLYGTRSSKSLHSTMMDKQILNNFNDSLISCLWELLCCSSSFMDSMKDKMQVLYAGLRFLRSILREHHEEMDEENEKIGALLSEAGIIIFLPSLNRVKEGEVSFFESTEARDFCDMLANTNINLKHFKDQISGSSTIESLSNSSHSTRVQEVRKPSRHMPSKGNIPTVHEVMVGLDDEAANVIERLRSGSEQLEIVPIVGMAGLGKTTLAKKVYNDSSIIYNFHIRLWCTVSQAFNMQSLLIQILCSDGIPSRIDEELKNLNEHELLQKLYQRLKTNRYLVVFDDVWDIRVWNELRNSFPDDKKRSRILFTSRFSNVASQVEYRVKSHNLRPLTEKESFELLQKKVFGKEDCPQALRGLGMEIAKRCRGLPLAVVVVAGVLATTEHDILVWEEFAKSLALTMVSGTDHCKQSLELSYENLPNHLKACLLYFAAFREDEIIYAKDLMRLWIAEGFVEKIEGKRLEDIAEEYLMDLIGRNLVMASKSRSIGGVKTCYIHDLIFEFCKTEAKEKNFLQVLRGYDELSTFDEPPTLPRLSICSSGEDFIRSRLFCPHLGSLLFFDAIGYEFPLLNISFIFSIYKHLKVLNLERINLSLTKLPTEVESLLCLRYLAVKAIWMRFIPSSIAKLSHLEAFCLKSSETVYLPNSIWNMKELRHIHVRRGSVVLPFASNDGLPNLDTLSNLCLYLDQEAENILGRIPNIRQLKIFNDREQSRLCCNMSRLECLESLTLELGSFFPNELDHVELSFPMNLKKLCLARLGLPCSKMSLIEQLPNLEVLKLRRNSLDGERWELMEGGFTKLRVLTLSDLNIVEWTEIDPDSDDYFPCLQQLILDNVTGLKMVPSCLGHISTLETIEIDHCRDHVTSLVLEIEEAQKNYGNENLEVIINWVSNKESCTIRD